MQLSGEHWLPAPRERVWAALLDADTLRQAIPGCESITLEAPGHYRVVVLASVGPVRARFKGRLQQQDLLPPQRYTLSFEGDGGLAGFAKGSAEVELAPGDAAAAAEDASRGAAATRLSYTAQAQIGGRMAQIGSRLIDATAAKLSAEFFERFAQVVGAGMQASTPGAGPVASAETSAQSSTVAQGPSNTTASAGAGLSSLAPNAPMVPSGRHMVSIQMPAWTWAFSVIVLALLVGWLAVR